jgi:hypothetical protein
LKGNGLFDIKSFYNALRDFHPMRFPWKAIWGVHTPRKISFYVWAATWGRILTDDNLKQRGFQLAGWCSMCRCEGETISHLLLHCETTYGLWTFVFRSFGISWVLPGCIPELLFGWHNWLGKNQSKIWNLVPSCPFWTLWWEWNSPIFENTERTSSQIYEFFSNTLYDWATAWGYSSSTSVIAFLDSLHIT